MRHLEFSFAAGRRRALVQMSVVEELESVVSANLLRAARLRQSILQKAFAEALV